MAVFDSLKDTLNKGVAPPPPAPIPGGVFCTNCGKSLPAGSRFCDECGAPAA